MKLIIFIIFWAIGIVLAFLGNRELREWRDYVHPVLYLVTGSFLCLFMSWAMVMVLFVEDEFEFPRKLHHSCRRYARVSYEEEYLDGDGNPTSPRNCEVHHTYRVITCRQCGKVVEREQLQ